MSKPAKQAASGWIKVFDSHLWHYFTFDANDGIFRAMCGAIAILSLPTITDQNDDGKGNCRRCKELKLASAGEERGGE